MHIERKRVEVAGPPSKAGMNSAEQARHQAAPKKRENETVSGGLKRSLTYQVRPIERAGFNPALSIGRNKSTSVERLQLTSKQSKKL